MSSVSANGVNVGGTIRELKEGVKVSDALQTSKNDGLDQAFLKADGKNYVAVWDGIDFNNEYVKNSSKDGVLRVSLDLDGKEVPAEIQGIDNELNSVDEALPKAKTYTAVIGGTILTAGIGLTAYGVANKGTKNGIAACILGEALMVATFPISVATLLGGSYLGSKTNKKPEQLEPLLKQQTEIKPKKPESYFD